MKENREDSEREQGGQWASGEDCTFSLSLTDSWSLMAAYKLRRDKQTKRYQRYSSTHTNIKFCLPNELLNKSILAYGSL